MSRLFSGLAVAVSLSLCGAVAAAQDTYPNRPVRLIIPQSPGSGGDLVGRMLAESLSKDLKQPVIVENRAGANGVVAAVSVAREAPDGYTLMLGLVSQLSFNQFLYKNTPYDGFKDFTYVNPVVETPYVLVSSKRSGIKDFAGFLAKARQEPGKLNFASAGTGNMTHLSMELLASNTGLKLTHVPYKGSGPALLSVISGESDLMVSVLGTALPQIQSGAVVPLAVLGAQRAKQIPDVPTLADLKVQVPVIPGWYALVGPAKMPQAVSDVIAASVHRFLVAPATQAKLADLYLEPMLGTGQELHTRAVADAKVWGKFIQDNGIQSE
ncbi:ABC transporter substrate-binding protein [Bordetella sp. N]|nr:ABC transporter substrate-binding protein [Bordetella sp. N]